MTGTVCEGTDECRLCKDPRVPGNYEPGDGSDGHEILELEQYDIISEGTDESRMCEDPHVAGNYEPCDDSEGYEILELEQYDRVCEGTDECSMCSRHGREHWQRQRYGHWQAADCNAHFIICCGFEVPQLVNFVTAQRHRTPACIQRSWPMCQYSYWADLNCAHKLAEPTLACWSIWMRSFRF